VSKCGTRRLFIRAATGRPLIDINIFRNYGARARTSLSFIAIPLVNTELEYRGSPTMRCQARVSPISNVRTPSSRFGSSSTSGLAKLWRALP
jgi:hypothetical protein